MKVIDLINKDKYSRYFTFKIRVKNNDNYNFYDITLSKEHCLNIIMDCFIILINKDVLSNAFLPQELTTLILVELTMEELKQISEFC